MLDPPASSCTTPVTVGVAVALQPSTRLDRAGTSRVGLHGGCGVRRERHQRVCNTAIPASALGVGEERPKVALERGTKSPPRAMMAAA